MSDFNFKYKVVQANNFIQAINKLDRTTFKVLKITVNEINESTTLNVSYTKVARKGRKITSIQWHTKEKDKDKAIGC